MKAYLKYLTKTILMKIKGWAVFRGCYAKGLGNSWVHRSTRSSLTSAKYLMQSTCCAMLNELLGEKKVIYHVKISKEMLIPIHTETYIPCIFFFPFFAFFFLNSIATLFPG